MPLTESQITEVEKLIGEGLDSHKIADKLGVLFMSVVGIRARMARVKNQELVENEEEIDDAIMGKFGLERDLQEALRANIA